MWRLTHSTVSAVYLASGEAAIFCSSGCVQGADYTERPSEKAVLRFQTACLRRERVRRLRATHPTFAVGRADVFLFGLR
ncbi:hypothetical protein [Kingella potus]|uniref:hypothetical protein n=1 Tax=Kingella potus TaxID=265175 RepID=UPI001FD118AB|nr:hypothetical protein [Kingella potus]UOP01957.1 hypothetical protein LVJ84_07605 [Kingella potus]